MNFRIIRKSHLRDHIEEWHSKSRCCKCTLTVREPAGRIGCIQGSRFLRERLLIHWEHPEWPRDPPMVHCRRLLKMFKRRHKPLNTWKWQMIELDSYIYPDIEVDFYSSVRSSRKQLRWLRFASYLYCSDKRWSCPPLTFPAEGSEWHRSIHLGMVPERCNVLLNITRREKSEKTKTTLWHNKDKSLQGELLLPCTTTAKFSVWCPECAAGLQQGRADVGCLTLYFNQDRSTCNQH